MGKLKRGQITLLDVWNTKKIVASSSPNLIELSFHNDENLTHLLNFKLLLLYVLTVNFG